MASLEFSLLVVAIISSLMMVSFAGRFYSAKGSVEDATAEAARSASLKDLAEASSAALTSAKTSLENICEDFEITTNTDNFRPGGFVVVDINCKVSLLGLSLLEIPGDLTLKARATEIIDRHRAESIQ